MLKNAIAWVFVSSAEPTQVSLTVRMALLGAVPYVLGLLSAACGVGLVCLGVDSDGLNALVDLVEKIVYFSLSLFAALGALYGFLRKVWLSVTGKNEVLNEML